MAAVYELTPFKNVCLTQVPQPARPASRVVARRLVGRASHGDEERRLVRRLLLGPDGVALRAGRHER